MSKSIYKIIFSLLFGFVLLISNLPLAYASNPKESIDSSERIIDYYSKIIVSKDSSLDVTEEITVRVNNENIKRGIYRDFPTKYKGPYGFRENVGFEILEIKKQNLDKELSLKTEPYRTESVINGVRIYIGDENIILDPGVYKYSIRYKTTFQLADLENSDQLYWNVTGNGWFFPIDNVRAEIILPGSYSKSALSLEGYQGLEGSTERNNSFEVSKKGETTIIKTSASRRLLQNEGFTVKINFPKGEIDYPLGYTGQFRILRDNLDIPILLFGTILFLFYCIYTRLRYGRDPIKQTVIPRFEPPKDFSPAGINFFVNKGFTNKSLTASIINLAIKGYLKIKEIENRILVFEWKEFEIEKLKEPDDTLPEEEKYILDSLFSNTATYRFKKEYNSVFALIVRQFTAKLNNIYFKKFYKFNTKFIILGALIFLLTFLIGFILSGFDFISYFTVIFISVFYTSFGSILIYLITKAKNIFLKILYIFFYVSLTTFFALMTLVSIFISSMLINLTFYPGILAFLNAFVFSIFIYLIQQMTQDGSRISSEIEGFRMYLMAAEAEDIKVINKEHPKTLDLFQKYLPYAIALDVETEWTSQFEDQIKQAQIDQSSDYASWYVGSSALSSVSSINSITSSISSSISSASTSSSSGGSSGGGGGGGGGGGW